MVYEWISTIWFFQNSWNNSTTKSQEMSPYKRIDKNTHANATSSTAPQQFFLQALGPLEALSSQLWEAKHKGLPERQLVGKREESGGNTNATVRCGTAKHLTKLGEFGVGSEGKHGLGRVPNRLPTSSTPDRVPLLALNSFESWENSAFSQIFSLKPDPSTSACWECCAASRGSEETYKRTWTPLNTDQPRHKQRKKRTINKWVSKQTNQRKKYSKQKQVKQNNMKAIVSPTTERKNAKKSQPPQAIQEHMWGTLIVSRSNWSNYAFSNAVSSIPSA